MKTLLIRHSKFIIISFFVFYFLIGLVTFRDYGVSWDEPIQYKYGHTVFNYIFNNDPRLIKSDERYYGPAFELILVSVEEILNLEDSRNIYLSRHLITFLTFFISTIFFYHLVKITTNDRMLSFLGAVFLILSPRIYADSFYNSKDIPLLAFFIISTFFLHKSINNNFIKYVGLSAFFSALLIDIRITGILIILIAGLLFIQKKQINKLFLYLISTTIFIFLLWPTLWQNPIKNFQNAFNQMSQYPQSTSILFGGVNLESTNLPWYYILGWISVTTPLLYIFLFVVGLLSYFYTKKLNELALIWLFFPVFAVIALKSVLYDGWRQLFFIYPAFILISLDGLRFLYKQKIKYIFIIITLGLLVTLKSMIQMHPFQNLYFNLLAGKQDNIRKKYELDYWGLSYKKAFEEILKKDPRDKIKVKVNQFPGIGNYALLNKQDRKRLEVKENMENPDYIITTFRGDLSDLPYSEFYSLYVNKSKIVTVYTF